MYLRKQQEEYMSFCHFSCIYCVRSHYFNSNSIFLIHAPMNIKAFIIIKSIEQV